MGTTCLGSSQELSHRLYPLLSLLQLSHSNILSCHLSLPSHSCLSAHSPQLHPSPLDTTWERCWGAQRDFNPSPPRSIVFHRQDSMLWGDPTESVSVCMDPMDPLLFPGQQPEHWDKQMLQGWDLSSLPGAEGPQGG